MGNVVPFDKYILQGIGKPFSSRGRKNFKRKRPQSKVLGIQTARNRSIPGKGSTFAENMGYWVCPCSGTVRSSGELE